MGTGSVQDVLRAGSCGLKLLLGLLLLAWWHRTHWWSCDALRQIPWTQLILIQANACCRSLFTMWVTTRSIVSLLPALLQWHEDLVINYCSSCSGFSCMWLDVLCTCWCTFCWLQLLNMMMSWCVQNLKEYVCTSCD